MALCACAAGVLLLGAILSMGPEELGSGPAAGLLPVGTVVAYTGERIPEGWLVCDGRSLRREEWPELYQAIRTSHGEGVSPAGVREADFNLPDYRGRFLRGVDLSQNESPLGSDPDAVLRSHARGGTGNSGNRVGSYQPDATAPPRDPGSPFRVARERTATASTRVPAGVLTGERQAGGEYGSIVFAALPGEPTGQIVTGGDPETRPKNVAVRWLIRAKP